MLATEHGARRILRTPEEIAEASSPHVSPPAGWYSDPEAPDQLRWWDGSAWSPAQQTSTPAVAGKQIAERARIIAIWAIAVGAVLWLIPLVLTLIPSPELQTIAILMVWAGFLPVVTLSILAILFGSIGLNRARTLGGHGAPAARFGLFGGIRTLAAPPVVAVVVALFVGIWFAIAG